MPLICLKCSSSSIDNYLFLSSFTRVILLWHPLNSSVKIICSSPLGFLQIVISRISKYSTTYQLVQFTQALLLVSSSPQSSSPIPHYSSMQVQLLAQTQYSSLFFSLQLKPCAIPMHISACVSKFAPSTASNPVAA
jgi:hypothetical protein